MAGIGPPPKRSDQRVRRNKPEVEIDKVTAIGSVRVPDLGLDDPHPMILDFYESLKLSAQTQYYEPSDWQFARWTLHWMDELLKSSKPSSMMLQTVNSALSDLLVTEGERRRVRMEIERGGQTPEQEKVASVSELFKERFAQ